MGADGRERRRQLATPSQSGLDKRRRRYWCGKGWMQPWRQRGERGEGTLLAAMVVLLVKY